MLWPQVNRRAAARPDVSEPRSAGPGPRRKDQALTNRTAPLPPVIGAPKFPSIALATGEMIFRVSALLYFVLEESLSLPLPLPACVACAVATVSIPSPGGAAVRSTIKSSRAISQVACTTAFGTVSYPNHPAWGLPEEGSAPSPPSHSSRKAVPAVNKSAPSLLPGFWRRRVGHLLGLLILLLKVARQAAL